jgi:hypothetical protein
MLMPLLPLLLLASGWISAGQEKLSTELLLEAASSPAAAAATVLRWGCAVEGVRRCCGCLGRLASLMQG